MPNALIKIGRGYVFQVMDVVLSSLLMMTDCASSTTAGTISPDRKQLMVYSNSELQRMAKDAGHGGK